MSADQSKPENDAESADKAAELSVGFAEFLTAIPPAQLRKNVRGVYHEKVTSHGRSHSLNTPSLKLHCPDCAGVRVFRYKEGDIHVSSGTTLKNRFIIYLCSNCQRVHKMYSLHINFGNEISDRGFAECFKFGEYPAYGDPTPERLRLFGKIAACF